eukprot:333758-Prymnesium_polylepis.1
MGGCPEVPTVLQAFGWRIGASQASGIHFWGAGLPKMGVLACPQPKYLHNFLHDYIRARDTADGAYSAPRMEPASPNLDL